MHCICTLYEFYVVPKPPGFHARVGKQVAYKLTEQEMGRPELVVEQEALARGALAACDAHQPFLSRLRPGVDGPDLIAACANALRHVWQGPPEQLDGLEWSLARFNPLFEGARVVCKTRALVP